MKMIPKTGTFRTNPLRAITVEPILLLVMLSMQMSQVTQQVGVYQVVCKQMYADRPEIDCSHLANVSIDGKSAEEAVQKRVTIWNMALGLSYMAPALFSDVLMGAFGDRYGRKINILWGIAGMMASNYPLVLLFTYPLSTPMYILVIAHLFCGFTGFISICLISSFAYLADVSPDPDAMTVRMAIMAVIANIGSIFGPFLAGATAKAMTQAQIVVLSEAIMTLAFFFCLIRIKQVPPAIMRRIVKEKYEKEHKQTTDSKDIQSSNEKPTKKVDSLRLGHFGATASVSNEKQSLLTLVISLLKETWHTYAKPRSGHVRIYLLIASLVFFLNIVSELGIRTSIFSLYVQKAPLSWSQDQIGYFKSAQGAMNAFGMMFGVVILKKWLRFTDTFIILIALASHIMETTLFAFTTETWMAYVAAGVGCLSGLLMPCVQSFVAKQVGDDEVGKSYTAFGISANIGMMVSSAVYNPIYYATLSFFPGFVFLFATLVLLLAFVAVLWLHVDSKFTDNRNMSLKEKFANSVFSGRRCQNPTMTNKVAPAETGVVAEKPITSAMI